MCYFINQVLGKFKKESCMDNPQTKYQQLDEQEYIEHLKDKMCNYSHQQRSHIFELLWQEDIHLQAIYNHSLDIL